MNKDFRWQITPAQAGQLKETVGNRRKIRFPVYLTPELQEADISELELSVRSTNCLHRAGVSTIGGLAERISGSEDLKKIRNCGRKSICEIMTSLFMYQFTRLSPSRQKAWLQEVSMLSSLSEEEAAAAKDAAFRNPPEKESLDQRAPLFVEEQDLSVGLEVLNLSVRAINCLKRSGIYDVSGLIDLLESEKSLMQIRNLGQKSAKEIVEKLQEYLEAERKS